MVDNVMMAHKDTGLNICGCREGLIEQWFSTRSRYYHYSNNYSEPNMSKTHKSNYSDNRFHLCFTSTVMPSTVVDNSGGK